MATIDLAEYKYSLTLDSSQYDANMDKADKLADKMKTKMSSVGGFLKGAFVGGMVAAGVAIVGTVAEGVRAASELEEQMSKFQSSTGATAQEVQEVQELAKELYKVNTDSMEDIVATSEAMVKQMGLTTDEVAKYQQAYMDYAKTTGQANTDVIGALDDIGDAWGLTAEDSVKALDMLKKSNEEYGTDIVAVQSALNQAAPAAKALGLSMEETNGYMNLFAASGLDANQAITAFTYASKQVESPEQFKQMMADISAITDPTERAQKAVELFGSKAGVAMSNVDTTQLNDFIITMDEANGSVTNASAAFDSNFNVQLELMKKQFSGLAIEVGEKFMPVINSVLQWVTANMPTIVSVISTAIDFVMGIISPLIGVVTTLFGAFTLGEAETNTAFTSIQTIISDVIEVVQGLVEAFVTLFTTVWDKWGSDIVAFAKQYFDNIMNNIKNAFEFIQSIIETVTALLSGDWEGFLEGLQNVAQKGWDLIKGIFKTTLDLISGIVDGAFQLIKTTISTILTSIVNTVKELPSKIKKQLDIAKDNVVKWGSDLIKAGKEVAEGLVKTVVDNISGLPSKMLTVGTDLVKGLWNGIQNMSKWLSDKISGFGEGVLNSLKSFFGIASPSKLFRDEIGTYLAEGIGVGFEDEIDNVNKKIQDSINTDFDINSNLVGGITDSRAMSDIERSISNNTYKNNSIFTIPVNIKMSDINVTGSVDTNMLDQMKRIANDAVKNADSTFAKEIKRSLIPMLNQALAK
jgi:phage-related protein